VTTGSTSWANLIRHNFAIATCNGCHYQETNNVGQSFHIKPREAGIRAELSPFEATLTDTPNNAVPTYYLTVPDPTDDTSSFHYNEPWRRKCEIRRVLSGETLSFTTATGHGFAINPLAPPTHMVTDLAFGATISNTGPSTQMTVGAFHGFDFNGKAGAIVTVTMNAAICGTSPGGMDTYLALYGPKDANGSYGLTLSANDDGGTSGCAWNSQIKSFHLPAAGNYLIVATSLGQAGSGGYSVQLTCESGVCTP
jgi:hypothetical protein